MSTTTIRGVQIDFPFRPYEVQRVLMERVIECLQTGANALLESPTGSGKSLSLLCSSRAWQKHHVATGEPKPLIIYASRTHLQLEQVSKELEKTVYAGCAITVASRENGCVHTNVSRLKGSDQISACKQLTSFKQCTHKNRSQAFAKHSTLTDIEDLNLRTSAEDKYCSYYYSRELISLNPQAVDICFMPYNYLIDPAARRGMNIPWTSSVVIIDEAHNISEVCEDAYSFTLYRTQLVDAIAEVDQLVRQFQKQPPQNASEILSLGELAKLKQVLRGLESGFAKCSTNNDIPTAQQILPVFAEQGIDCSTCTAFFAKLDMCIDALNQCRASAVQLGSILKCFTKVFTVECDAKTQTQELNEYYRVVADKDEGQGGGWRVNVWCFSASLAFQELKRIGIRSIIVASGTLSPLDSFASALKIPFRIRLESPHVVAKERVFLGCIPLGVTGVKLNGSYQHRNNAGYAVELGNTLVALARVIPDGVLVFFSSYSALQTCITAWKSNDVWDRLLKLKEALVVEQRTNSGNEEYDSALQTGGGAMMFAVCRGKASEGMDFRDKRARGVIMIGLPFPSSQDARVKHKRAYLDQTNKLGGSAWYTQQAYRAVNQAIGRAIRHEKDYGAIILLDERFSTYQNNLSQWLRPCFQHFDQGPRQAIPQLVQFFKRYKSEVIVAAAPSPAAKRPVASPIRTTTTTTTTVTPSPPPKAPRLEAKFSVSFSDKDAGSKFCSECRKALTQPLYQDFKLLLRDYHAYSLDAAPTALNNRAIQLFSHVADRAKRLQLLQTLCSFLPGRFQYTLQSQVKQSFQQ